jgi:cellulose biosynthesis protein BcsQ
MKARQDEYIIIDGRAGDAGIARGILLDSDLVLIPSSPSRLDMEVTSRQCQTVQQIRKVTQSDKPAAFVVLNKLGKDKLSLDAMELRMIEDINVFNQSLKQRSPYADAAGRGCLVWDLPFYTLPAQREMTTLFQELWKYIQIPDQASS